MSLKKWAGVTVGIAAAIAGGLWGGMKYLQSQSPRQLMKNEEGDKVAVEELSFYDGEDKIYGKVYKSADSLRRSPVIVFCHGIGVNADYGERYCKDAVSQGFVAYSFDFRGGSPDCRSTGRGMTEMSVVTEKDDLDVVLKRLKRLRYVDKNKIFLMGHSQGGLVAAMEAADKPSRIAGLILLAPAFNIPSDGLSRYPKARDIPDTTMLGIYPLGRVYYKDMRRLDPYKGLDKYKGDVLIIQGTADTAVPSEWAEKAAEAFPSATLKTIEGADHNFTGASSSQALAIINDYLSKHR